MSGWKTDKRKSDIYLPALKRILGEHLIGEPPVAEDQERNTDLIVLRMEAVRIAARVRENKWVHSNPNDFTIRSKRPSGVKTELHKIIEGWGDYMIYGFAEPTGPELAAWHLLDLNVFRLSLATHLINNHGQLPGHLLENKDGSSAFLAFNLNQFPPQLVVARKTLNPETRAA